MELYNRSELEREIQLLEAKKKLQQQELKLQLQATVDSVKPVNLLKDFVLGDDSDKPSKKGLLGSIGSMVFGFAGKKFLPNLLSGILPMAKNFLMPSAPKAKTADNKIGFSSDSNAKKSLIATALTAGAGVLINSLTKSKSKSKTSLAVNSMINAGLTTLIIGNIDKVASYIDAAIKTDFGKKSPEELR